MASEDVLHRYAAMLLSGGSNRTADAAMMEALAAEVRELRRDKARLAALCKWVSERDCEFSIEGLIAIADEELAAMGGE